jgi:hypothetical protein
MGKIDPKVINQVRLYARNWPKINDLGEKWASQTITHAPKTFKKLKDLIKTEKDFPRKVIRSGLKAAMKFIRTGYIIVVISQKLSSITNPIPVIPV